MEAVTVVIAVGQTAEVGQTRGHAGSIGDALGHAVTGEEVAHITEVLRITGKDVGAGSTGADVVALALDIGHTCHDAEGVLAGKSNVVVCKVLPLIVETSVVACRDAVKVSLDERRAVIRLSEAVAVALVDAIAEAGGEHHTLERHEVRGQGTADVESLAGGIIGVTAYERATSLGFTQTGNGPIEAGIGILEDLVPLLMAACMSSVRSSYFPRGASRGEEVMAARNADPLSECWDTECVLHFSIELLVLTVSQGLIL